MYKMNEKRNRNIRTCLSIQVYPKVLYTHPSKEKPTLAKFRPRIDTTKCA